MAALLVRGLVGLLAGLHPFDRRADRLHDEEDDRCDHRRVAVALDQEDYNPALVLGEVLTAVVTPFREDGSGDLDGFRTLCRFLLENGCGGVVVTGTTGEAPTLSDEERMALYEAAVDVVGGRGTVVAGTGTNSTSHSIHLTEQAHELGVDGFLVVTPYYN